MKKVLISLFLLALIISPLIFAADIEDTLGQGLEKAQAGEDLLDKSTDQVFWEEKWDYLGKEWKSLILKNKFVSRIDGFFTKISIVFQVLFGVPYSMSLALFGIIILWIFFLMNVSRVIGATGFFEGNMSLLGGLLFAIILAQFRVYEIIVVFLGNVIFSPQYMWTRVILFVVVVGLFMVFDYFDRFFGVYLKKLRKKKLSDDATTAQKALKWLVKSIEEGEELGK